MAVPPQSNEAFLREVDEELRRDQIFGFWRRYGRLVAVLVGAFLLAFGGWLWWQNRQAEAAGAEGETLTRAIDRLSANDSAAARPLLEQLSTSDREGYRAAARLALGATALQAGDAKAAAERFAAIANDPKIAQPLRELALIRQTTVEFDQLPPDTVIDRLKGVAQKGSPWFGSAGELVAAAHLKAGRPKQAGAIFAALAADPGVPETLRSRAVQIASVLGVEAGSPLQSLNK